MTSDDDDLFKTGRATNQMLLDAIDRHKLRASAIEDEVARGCKEIGIDEARGRKLFADFIVDGKPAAMIVVAAITTLVANAMQTKH